MKYTRTRKLVLKTIEAAKLADMRNILAHGSSLFTLYERLQLEQVKRAIGECDMNARQAAEIWWVYGRGLVNIKITSCMLKYKLRKKGERA